MQKKERPIEKRWILRDDGTPATHAAAADVATALGVSRIMGQLLVNRGYKDPVSAKSFIQMESELLCDPLMLEDIRPAVERIRRAVKTGEHIAIYGDYDVDGVTSVCTLYHYLTSLGASVEYYIPNRSEGYGVSAGAVDMLLSRHTGLVITVDTGITAVTEVAYAKEKGLDFVITDHHECHMELPSAVAVVNPHRPDCPYPFKDLAGVGVVFKVICAYEEITTGDKKRECVARICRKYADLVAIGTIADVMPLIGENKLIVSYGLRLMEKERRPGLAALMAASNPKPEGGNRYARPEPKITSGYIGYTIAPRLNAAGRIRSATLAVELFLSATKKQAEEVAALLCEANRERQNEENRIMKEAFAKIEAEHNFENDPVIVLSADNWHQGVIGIVSSRITEKYGLPSVLISFEGCDAAHHTPEDVGKGSGRSVPGMNLVDALVYSADTLRKHGGHALAAGLSIARGDLPAFREKINEYARTHLEKEDLIPVVEADCSLAMEDLTLALAAELRMLEPFGVGNPTPAFALYGATVEEILPFGGGKHTRLLLRDGVSHVAAVYFSHEAEKLHLYPGEKIDLLFNLDINEWNGKRTLQLIVRDLRPAKRLHGGASGDKARFAEIYAGASFRREEKVVPTREDFVAVYHLVRGAVKAGVDTMPVGNMLTRLRGDGRDIGYIKLKLIFCIFKELDLVDIGEPEEDLLRFRIRLNNRKADLENSVLLRSLREREEL